MAKDIPAATPAGKHVADVCAVIGLQLRH